MTTSSLSPEQTIVSVADADGVNPRLALAIAANESGFNPQAIGDDGTSFGLFQLHEGGELGNLTETEAFDPATNAQTALSVVAAVEHANPSDDPGTIAADAQRPADPSAYAAAVDSYYNNPSFFPGVTSSTAQPTQQVWDELASSSGSTATLTSLNWKNIVNGLFGVSTPDGSVGPAGATGDVTGITGDIEKGGAYIVALLAGAGLIVAGIYKLANPGGSITQSVTHAAGTAGKAASTAALA